MADAGSPTGATERFQVPSGLRVALAEHIDGTLLTADTKLAMRVSAALPGRATVA